MKLFQVFSISSMIFLLTKKLFFLNINKIFFFLSLISRNSLNLINIRHEIWTRKSERKLFSLFIDIFDVRITEPVNIVPFCKSTRIARHILPTIQLFSMGWIKCAIAGVVHSERSRYDVISHLNDGRNV